MSSIVINLSEGEEVYKEKINTAMDYCFDELLNEGNLWEGFEGNDVNEKCAVVMCYDFEKEINVFKVVNTLELCKIIFNLMKETKEYYDVKLNPKIYLDVCESSAKKYHTHKKLKLLTFKSKDNVYNTYYSKCRFIVKDDITLASIKSILNSCSSEKMLNLCFDYVWNEDKMVEMWEQMYSMTEKPRKRKIVVKEEKPKEEKPKEKIPREEIPREKTLSKKEKEKLKKQKAKEANKLREQEKKDKAKLAEQQAKQFEKQQKERERKRIETARKKKLALLKK